MKTEQTLQQVLNKWEFYTLEGDAYYHQQDYKQASKLFTKCVSLLEPWLEKEHKQAAKVLRLFVLSCHNSAHALSKWGHHKDAEYYYSHAHFRLLSFISHTKPRALILEMAITELKGTFAQLKQYLLDKNKVELAGNIKEESMRVVRQCYLQHADQVFTA